jgi:2-iminoacetate synthase ThiH
VARLLLHGRIDHVQAAWPKLGPELTVAVLRGGADDAGGLLLDGALDPAAGAEAGRELTLDDVEGLAADLGRTPRQRTTVYGDAPPERQAVLRRETGAPA